ncbi:Protein disulfide-isomerase [Hibiscus syriacus]|uniref:protein disulfide-isomerase n=1 Tax=Hibiscus syriacus TaxID=106335 RepID=A0A6A2XIS1_HIBSY|nr:Protein disulfide-isomerase [Hibiscus syriacus]
MARISKHKFIVVEFYAPWCGHCRNLAPEYEKAASILSKHYPPVILAKVDANEEANKADGIVEYLKKQSGPASAELKSTEDATELIDDKKIVVVGVFQKFSGEDDWPCGQTFQAFDELFVDFKDFNVEALEKFVEESSIPLVTLFNKDPSNHPFVIKFYNSPNHKAMLFANLSGEGIDPLKSKYREVAEQYKQDGIGFLLGDLEASQAAFQYFGVQESQVPLIIIQNNDGKKYLKPNLKADDIAPFVKDYKEGKVSPYVKSEPVPEENNEPVKVVVADTLEDMVFKSGKNVLLEFMPPGVALQEIAVHYEKDASVLIAKLDATVNDIVNESFDVRGYPTIYFRSSSGNITPYEGDRTKEDIINFIEQNKDKTVKQESAKDEL